MKTTFRLLIAFVLLAASFSVALAEPSPPVPTSLEDGYYNQLFLPVVANAAVSSVAVAEFDVAAKSPGPNRNDNAFYKQITVAAPATYTARWSAECSPGPTTMR